MALRSSWVLAGGLAVLSVAWIVSGVVFPSEKEVSRASLVTNRTEEAAPLRVRVQTLTAQPVQGMVVTTGLTRSMRRVDVKAETEGRVEEIAVTKGATVAEGAVLMTLSLKDRNQQLAQAQARVRQRQLEFEQASKLAQRDFASRTRLTQTEAELREAQAALAKIKQEVSETAIRAPFAGIFNANLVEIGDYLAVGDKVATVIEMDPLRVIADVPERDISHVAVGSSVDVRLVDGRSVTGAVTWVSRSSTTATRTFPVEIQVANPDAAIAEGMTAEVRLPTVREQGHLVSPAVLTLNDAGEMGVKLVTESNIVEFRPVRVLRDSNDGVWLGGLPGTARVITVGHEFVKAGQVVDPVEGAAMATDPAAGEATSPAGQRG